MGNHEEFEIPNIEVDKHKHCTSKCAANITTGQGCNNKQETTF